MSDKDVASVAKALCGDSIFLLRLHALPEGWHRFGAFADLGNTRVGSRLRRAGVLEARWNEGSEYRITPLGREVACHILAMQDTDKDQAE